MRGLRGGITSCLAALALAACAEGPQTHVQVSSSTSGPFTWTTVWFDDFDGTDLDRTKWAPEKSCWGGGNNERQCYTDRLDNVRIEDGILRLIAQKEEFEGPLYPQGHPGNGRAVQPYTSGKVRTRGLADWKYGRFSARMKLPPGQGAWSAFWMMPAHDVYGTWPRSGEIDIMEAVNLETPCEACVGGVETRTSGALHFGDYAPNNTYLHAHTSGEGAASPAAEWRTYTLEWGEGTLQWFVDDQLFMRLTSQDWHTASPKANGRVAAPFDQPFYLMLNLAVGGNLPERSNGGGFDPEAFPAEMLVDWVRVETCLGDENTGRACLSKQPWSGKPKGPWEANSE